MVIPVFRATDALRQLVGLILTDAALDLEKIVLVFDDGDLRAWNTAKELARGHARVSAVRLGRNFGQHNATICGFNFCKGDFIVTMDEDLQHDPADIHVLLAEQRKGDQDVIYGNYRTRKHNWWRNQTSACLKGLLRIGLPGLHPGYTSFRLIRRDVALSVVGMKNPYTFLDGYLAWVTSSVAECPTDHGVGEGGPSSYSMMKLVSHTFRILFNFTNLPIRVLTALTLLTLTGSLAYATYVVITALMNKDYLLGFPTLIAIMGIGFGVLLLGITVMVQYLSRINEKATQRPTWVVRETVNGEGVLS